MATATNNKVTYGLRNVYIAFLTEGATAPAYSTPVHIPGAVALKLDPQGSTDNFYADDTVWYTGVSNTGFSGNMDFYGDVPADVISQMLGETVDSNGGVYGTTDDVPKPFALVFEVQGDAAARRTVYYHVTAARASDDNSTKEDKISPAKYSFSITAIAETINSKHVTHYTVNAVDSAKAYAAMITAIPLPDATYAG